MGTNRKIAKGIPTYEIFGKVSIAKDSREKTVVSSLTQAGFDVRLYKETENENVYLILQHM